MYGLLEGSLWVFAEFSLDLLGPVADRILKNSCLVFGGGLLGVSDVLGREGQVGFTFNQAQGDLGVGEELVELLHQVLRHQVGPADLIMGVT